VYVCSLPELQCSKSLHHTISSQVRRRTNDHADLPKHFPLAKTHRRIPVQSSPVQTSETSKIKKLQPLLLSRPQPQPLQQTHSCWSNLTSQGDHRDHRICERPLPTITVSTAHPDQAQNIIAAVVSIKARIRRCLQHTPAATDIGLYNNCERLELAIDRMLPANKSSKIHNSV
jgi:hypothetical protein